MSLRKSWLLLVISLSTCKYCFIEILIFCVALSLRSLSESSHVQMVSAWFLISILFGDG